MNVRPGDLARIIPTPESGPEQVDKIVRITRLHSLFSDCWEYEGALISPEGVRYSGVDDKYLRPIANPGDDAQDETLSWKPVPAELPERIRV